MFGKISQTKNHFSVDMIVSAIIRNIYETFDYPGDMHDFWEMVYVIDGNATITEDENVYLMTSGNVIFHRPMEFHKLYIQYQQNSPTKIMILSFKCSGSAIESLGDGLFMMSDSQQKDLIDMYNTIMSTYKWVEGEGLVPINAVGENAKKLPVPMMNILNGGAHASNNVDIQEFMIVPFGIKTFAEQMRAGCEIYAVLGKILKEKGLISGVGDEGGYAPSLSGDEEALELIIEAVFKAGYNTDAVGIALDVASSEWAQNGAYLLPKRNLLKTSDELIEDYENLCEKYPIISIEDGLGEDDTEGWKKLTERLGKKINLVGDDLFVTNTKRLKMGIKENIANSILVKLNQIGTLSETLDVMEMAKKYGYKNIVSHRSGESEDTFIADLAVAVNAPFIKSGAPCRSDRVAKYNRLLLIEKEI